MSTFQTQQPSDIALAQAMALSATPFPITTLSAGSKRLRTALAANAGTNTQILDESKDLMAITFAAATPMNAYLTELGTKRLELENVGAPGV